VSLAVTGRSLTEPLVRIADERLVEAFRAGDEAAFATLVDRHSPLLLRLAQLHTRAREVAEEVVQETWLNVLRSIDGFAGRSSFRTWLVVILVNTARRRAAQERRSTPFSALRPSDDESVDPDAGRFFGPEHPRWAGCWSTVVDAWDEVPEEHLLGSEATATVASAAAELPELQRSVFLLRDVHGLAASDVCNALGLSDSNQRVLLHRARTRIRRALELYFEQEVPA